MSLSSRKKKCIFSVVSFFFSNIRLLWEYRISFRNICIFTYQKTLLHTFFCLFLKSSEAISVSLNETIPTILQILDNIIGLPLSYTKYWNSKKCQMCIIGRGRFIPSYTAQTGYWNPLWLSRWKTGQISFYFQFIWIINSRVKGNVFELERKINYQKLGTATGTNLLLW